MPYDVRTIQRRLTELGYNPGPVDGSYGPLTKGAVMKYQRDMGIGVDGIVGPITYARLTGDTKPLAERINGNVPPWYAELASMMGKHETRDNALLKVWLKSDGATVGDPAEIPWCGDAVQTAIRLTLPTEDLPSNPYAAINWQKWGRLVVPQVGAILVFWRGSPNGWQGHVGLYAGESDKNFYVLGGNQNNSVNISPIAKDRLRAGGSRWPLTAGEPQGRKVLMSGGVISTNEE